MTTHAYWSGNGCRLFIDSKISSKTSLGRITWKGGKKSILQPPTRWLARLSSSHLGSSTSSPLQLLWQPLDLSNHQCAPPELSTQSPEPIEAILDDGPDSARHPGADLRGTAALGLVDAQVVYFWLWPYRSPERSACQKIWKWSVKINRQKMITSHRLTWKHGTNNLWGATTLSECLYFSSSVDAGCLCKARTSPRFVKLTSLSLYIEVHTGP